MDNGTAGVLPGSTDALGGGILNSGGKVSLSNVSVQSNQALGSNGHNALGAAISSLGGSLVLSSSTITNNTAIASTGVDGAVGTTGTSAHPNGGMGGNGSNGGNAAGGGLFINGSVVRLTATTVSANKVLEEPAAREAPAALAGAVARAAQEAMLKEALCTSATMRTKRCSQDKIASDLGISLIWPPPYRESSLEPRRPLRERSPTRIARVRSWFFLRVVMPPCGTLKP